MMPDFTISIDMPEIFLYPFMIRALISGAFIAVILGALGVFVVTRKMSFIGDGIAHASLAGIALALLLGWAPIPVAVVFSAAIAALIYFLEKKTNISGDMAIAIMFTTGMAIGIILLNFYQGYQPELISYLFGNILAINAYDLMNITVIGSLVLLGLLVFYRQILFSTFDPVGAYLSGLNPAAYDLMLYAAAAVSIVLSIKLVGIILVSALLVTPSAIARLFAKSFRGFLFLSIAFSAIIVMAGLAASYYLDLPSGAVIILAGTTLFLLSALIAGLKKRFA